MSITTTRRQDELYSVEMVVPGVGFIAALVTSPRRQGARIFSNAEREVIARVKAQDLALGFADEITDFEGSSGPSTGDVSLES
jgi:hypothetical protein